MLAVGGIAVRLAVTGAALNYIRPIYVPLLGVAGALLVGLGGSALWRSLRRPDAARPQAEDAIAAASADHGTLALAGAAAEDGHDGRGSDGPDGHDGSGHGHDHARGPRVAWLLALPLFAVVLVAPPALGSFAANRQSGVLQSTRTSYPPLPAPVDGAVPLQMGEYTVRALYDTEESLRGARVRLTGFVSEILPDGYVLTRFALACCAADGTAIDVVVRGDPRPRAIDGWLEVEGVWEPRPGHVQGDLTLEPPLFEAETVTEIAQPAEPYEY